MRTANSESIRAQALRLKPLERAQLANALFNSIGKRRLEEIQALWETEIAHRLTIYRAGQMPVAPASEVASQLRQTFGWQK